jgi:enoyl-CoA hydratase/carnithine racemase
MTASNQPCVETRREEHLLIISMRREAKRNAINREMADQLDAALNQLDDDDSLWAAVLEGCDSIFCAGSDLTCNGDYVTERGGEYGIIRRIRRKPLIAAVEGAALGGGLEIVLACDLVVASRSARFGLPEVSIGVLPTCAALFRAPNALPLNLARELILTGDPISAERAHAAGLVNHLTEPSAALPRALELAARIVRNAPLSVQGCLQSVNEWAASGDELGWRLTGRALDGIKDTEDIREGVRSFLEKRPPKWQGR